MALIYNSRGRITPEITEYKATGTAAVAITVNPGRKFRFLNMTAHGASSVADAITITLDSKEGAAYDTILSTSSNWTNVYIKGEVSEVFEAGDVLKIDCANAAVAKGVVVRIEEL